MLMPFCDFPVRSARQRGESLAGYVYRFYWENGHEPPTALRATVRDLYCGDRPGSAFSGLESVMGALGTAESAWWVSRRLDTVYPGGFLSKWRRLHFNPVRYCPACLRKFGFHADLWTLPLAAACPWHQCVLLSRCAVCGQLLPWSALKPGWHCGCGAAMADAPLRPAAPWAIRLAATLASAADAERSAGDVEGSVVSMPADQRDSVCDLYDYIGWAFSLRRQLGRRAAYQSAPRWPVCRNPKAHVVPGVWEERLLFTELSTDKGRLNRLAKWNFRHQPGLLVVLSDEAPLALAIKALGGLPRNRHTEGLHCAVEKLLGGLRAGIEGFPAVYFHPRFADIERQPYLAALSTWWYKLANRIAVLDPRARLVSLWPNLYGGNTASVVQILNALLDAATRDEDVEQYAKLATRWHVPARLQRKLEPSEVLRELGGYLASLQSSELAFVLDLLNDAGRPAACQ